MCRCLLVVVLCFVREEEAVTYHAARDARVKEEEEVEVALGELLEG